MKTSPFIRLAVITLIVLSIISCKDKQSQFTIQGSISDADSAYIYLEKRSLTQTVVIDSVKPNDNGEFSFKEAVPEYPEFYSLRLKGQSINFAIDSVESITIKASAPTFATGYSISGSESASRIREVSLNQYQLSNTLYVLNTELNNKQITQNMYLTKVTEAIDKYKEAAQNIIKSDYTSMAAYYTLFQKVNDYLIFDPYEKKDLRLFQTVATIWKQKREGEPRAEHLEKFTLQILSEVRSIEKQNQILDSLQNKSTTVEANEFYNITLPDLKNNPVNLFDLKGKVILLDFTAYQTDYSPAHNIMINRIYERYKNQVDVYQVSFDSDEHYWRNTAVNLPWKCVRDSKSLQSNLLYKYNIEALPTTFILNKNGDIVKRLTATDDVSSEIRKIL